MASRELTERLVSAGRAAGLDAVGFASAEVFARTRADLLERKAAGLHAGMQFTYKNPVRSTDPRRVMTGARALVVGAASYHRHPPDTPPVMPSGRVARYVWGDRYGPLRAGLGAIAHDLRAEGWRAIVFADDNSLVDRAAAHRAGLGWFGKNANLLLPDVGSWFVLGSVLTDAPLVVTAEPVPDRCGACTRCIPACPTGAIVAPGVVDARRCLAWLVQAPGVIPFEHRVAMGDRVYGCDDCQEVCPPNRRWERDVAARRPGGATGPEPGDTERVSLLGWLAMGDDELLARHGRWYISGRDPRFLRRNALVALGNVADPGDVAVASALGAVLSGTDGLLRAHAVWAAARLGHDELLPGAEEADPLVRAELARVASGDVPVRVSSRPHGAGAPCGG